MVLILFLWLFQVVEMLNGLYLVLDSRIEHYHVYKVETINETYMLAAGKFSILFILLCAVNSAHYYFVLGSRVYKIETIILKPTCS